VPSQPANQPVSLTINQPVSPEINQPITPAGDHQPVPSATSQQMPALVTDQAMSPPATNQAVSLTAIEPVSPEINQPTSPAADHQPVPSATNQPVPPTTTDQPVLSPSSVSSDDLPPAFGCSTEIDNIVTSATEHILSNGFQNYPVEMLRYLQEVIVQGRPLEIPNTTDTVEGETSLIYVDRQNVLVTGLDEVRRIENKRLTLEVQFYGEVCFRNLFYDNIATLAIPCIYFHHSQEASDYGGPRKEFFHLILHEINEKFFKDGLKDFRHLDEDYHIIGVIMGNACKYILVIV